MSIQWHTFDKRPPFGEKFLAAARDGSIVTTEFYLDEHRDMCATTYARRYGYTYWAEMPNLPPSWSKPGTYELIAIDTYHEVTRTQFRDTELLRKWALKVDAHSMYEDANAVDRVGRWAETARAGEYFAIRTDARVDNPETLILVKTSDTEEGA